nr:hypothetical protein [Pontibacter harenae]
MNMVKNGRTYYGKARGKCKDCLRQFVFEGQNQGLSQEQKRLIELLLLERISLEGICRVLDIPAYHLYRYMDELYGEVPQDLNAQVACNSESSLGAMSAKAMSCGALSASKATSNGYGWPRTGKAGK